MEVVGEVSGCLFAVTKENVRNLVETMVVVVVVVVEDAVGAVKRSVLQWRFIDGIAAKIDETELRQAQQAKDAVRAYELVYAALGA